MAAISRSRANSDISDRPNKGDQILKLESKPIQLKKYGATKRDFEK